VHSAATGWLIGLAIIIAGWASIIWVLVHVFHLIRPIFLTVLLGAVMLQCFATRQKARCDVWELYDDIGLCRSKAREYNKLDNRVLVKMGVPVIVDYKCQSVVE